MTTDLAQMNTKASLLTTMTFLAGGLMVLLELCLYALNVDSSGKLFTAGMVLLLAGALLSALTERTRPKMEDMLTVAAGLCFFGWLGWKAFN
ncbi:hypothetical protein [Pseudomonas sp. TMB3-21]